jgi:hypothetical protein
MSQGHAPSRGNGVAQDHTEELRYPAVDTNSPPSSPKIARLAYTKRETAEALGVSVDFIDDHVWRELKLVRWGSKTLAPVREIEALLERKAARTLD